jgi:mRNA-degrading endonuclease toxin of MazEF toxin-antitoxin module
LIGPGAVFEIPAELADPPQRRHELDPVQRTNRWVLIVSSKIDCRDARHPTVLVVLLSAQIEWQGRHDVLIKRPDGGIRSDSIAQTDLVFAVDKRDLPDELHRGDVMADTLRQVRAKLGEGLGFGPSIKPE